MRSKSKSTKGTKKAKVAPKKTNRWKKNKALLAKAEPYIDIDGAIVKEMPSSIFCKLLASNILICAGDLIKPNLEGKASRWFVTRNLSHRHKLCSMLTHLEKAIGMKTIVNENGDRIKIKDIPLKDRTSFGNNSYAANSN